MFCRGEARTRSHEEMTEKSALEKRKEIGGLPWKQGGQKKVSCQDDPRGKIALISVNKGEWEDINLGFIRDRKTKKEVSNGVSGKERSENFGAGAMMPRIIAQHKNERLERELSEIWGKRSQKKEKRATSS